MNCTFTDALGRTWDLTLNLAVIKRVKKETELDLGSVSPELFTAMGNDVYRVVDALACILSAQIESANLTEDDFAAGLTGATIRAATDSLLQAMIEFLPPKNGAVLRKMAEKMGTVEDELLARASAKIDALNVDEIFGAVA